MKTQTRRAVAYISARLASGRMSGSIYDYQEKRHVNMSGNVANNSVSVYDHEQKCHITGSGTSLYHHGNRKHVNLQMNGATFSGYDYDSKKHFSGNVNGSSVSLYDHETKRHHNYSI